MPEPLLRGPLERVSYGPWVPEGHLTLVLERRERKKRIVMTFHFTASIHTVFIALVEFDFSELVIILLFLVTYLLNFLITGMEKFDIDNAVSVTIL